MEESGEIVRIVSDRGFGFIRSPGAKSDVFFHARDIDPARGVIFADLKLGQWVRYSITHTDKGPRAIDLQLQ